MKTPAQAAAKYNASTAVGEQTWLQNLQGTTKPIVAAAVAQRAVMQSNFQGATAAGGRWQTNLEAVGDAGIKAAAQAKQSNYSTGVQNGQPKFASAITKILAYEAQGLPQIYAMPSGTTAAGIARASAWIQYMAAGKGQLGAS
ncbi:MAG: hypothetical protein ACRDUT_00095 [Mycobacterium sp.]